MEHCELRFSFACLVLFLATARPALSLEDKVIFEASFSGHLTISDGTSAFGAYIKPGKPLNKTVVFEPFIGIEHRLRHTALTWAAALRKDFPQPRWTPFLRLGYGAETNLVGPFAETKSLWLAGFGGLIPFFDGVALRFDYELQRLHGTSFDAGRHNFLLGVLIQWK